MRAFLSVVILFISLSLNAQSVPSEVIQSDTSSAASDSAQSIVIDTAAIYRSARSEFYNSPITSANKPKWYDIEQQRNHKSDTWVFFILLLLLIILTALKLAFHNDFENLFKVFANSNATSHITLSSVFMSAIFIISISMLTRFILLHFYAHSVLQNNFSIVILIILFTFFSIIKYALLKYIGNIFEIMPVVDEYLLNLSAITRTIGISMIPILFMLYASSEKYFNPILIISLMIFSVGIVMIVIRGLSTSYKLMYSSMYHFLIYICVGEILPVFLFIKLLTKTVI